MLVRNKKSFSLGGIMLVGFSVVFISMFTPNFGDGNNAFTAADKLFNSISKGSTYYIPAIREAAKGGDKQVTLNLHMASEAEAAKVSTIFGSVAEASASGSDVTVTGNLAAILGRAVDDSDAMFANNEEPLKAAYNLGGQEGMYMWWKGLKAAEKNLKKQELFKEAALVNTVINRGVEVGYNYYGIQPESASSRTGILAFSLIFYVVYTLWFGYSIFFLCEGMGLAMKGGKKKEV
ncbi:hypothetical protein N1030_10645 [Desulfovibrio mangrovi]|uniref:hypothetical protein n=1 Tax=Desulfovibrio mangrovi TaxID=2976983 RepID=UPI0022463DDC|nr:hypothetical protein [Desulfovibrio mangrovi]UZP66081.1 hypothetical protein N1030_10645 [Desulfovibrio mangrovi]